MRIAVLGAGAGGLCAFAQLDRAGFDDVVVYEQSDGVGGTWRDNTYPGAACDIPAHLYCFSFAPKRDWSRRFAPQPEILEYFEDLADRIGIRPHLRLGTQVRAMRWDDASSSWELEFRTPTGEVGHDRVDAVVAALGQLNRPYVPDLDGLEDFEGPAFHAARWDHSVDLTGRRVGVVGNSASAVQLVPEVARDAAHLTVFQRSANWIVPKPERHYTRRQREAMRRVPGLARASRWWTFLRLESMYWGVIRRGGPLGRLIRTRATAELTRLASDRLPVEALVPDFDPGCNRLLLSSDYYATLLRPNVSVELSHLRRVEADAVLTADGRRHQLDALVFATGFRATEFLMPLDVVGRDGRLLHQEWRDGASAHLGIVVEGFPNLFLVYGPNTNLGHNSILFMIEAQVRWTVAALRDMRRRGWAAIEPSPAALDRFARRLERDLEGTVWSGGCRSWYKTDDGRVTNNWPATATAYWRRTRRFDPDELVARPRRGPPRCSTS